MKLLSSTAVYPRTYNPSFAVGACVLAILFASIFTLIFPLIAPAVVVLLLLSLVGKPSGSQIAETRLTTLCSTPFPCWLRLCSYTFADGWSSAVMAAQTFRDTFIVPPNPPGAYPPLATFLGRGKHPGCNRRSCHLDCGILHECENKASRSSIPRSCHAGFTTQIRERHHTAEL